MKVLLVGLLIFGSLMCWGQTRDECKARTSNEMLQWQICLNHANYFETYNNRSVGLVQDNAHHLYPDKNSKPFPEADTRDFIGQKFQGLEEFQHKLASVSGLQWDENGRLSGYDRYENPDVLFSNPLLSYDLSVKDSEQSLSHQYPKPSALTLQLQASQLAGISCDKKEQRQYFRQLIKRLAERELTKLLLRHKRAGQGRLYIHEFMCSFYRDGQARKIVLACPYKLTDEQKKACRKQQKPASQVVQAMAAYPPDDGWTAIRGWPLVGNPD